jgi:hypothetical protein
MHFLIPHKYILCLTLMLALLLAACKQAPAPVVDAPTPVEAEPFRIQLIPEAGLDSAARSHVLYVAMDDHFDPHRDTLPGDLAQAWRVDSLRPDASGRYAWEGASRDVAEVYLTTPSGDVCTLLAAAGEDYTWTYNQSAITASDTLNAWMQRTLADLQGRSKEACRQGLDSLCRADSTLRAALLLRQLLPTVSDTLFLRRCLGHLPAAAKPAWLMYDIDRRMDERFQTEYSGILKRNYKFSDAQGERFNFSSLNRGNLLVYFWADYDAPSVAALRRLKSKDAKIKVMTFCLHAADSAAWRKSIASVEGRHVWLADGLNHPMLRTWGITRPGVYLLLTSSARVLYRGLDEKGFAHSVDSIAGVDTPRRALKQLP